MRQYLSELKSCRICRRIFAAIFLLLLLVEAAVLLFLVDKFERDRLLQTEREALVLARAIIRAVPEEKLTSNFSGLGAEMRRHSVLLGASLISKNGRFLRGFGQLPDPLEKIDPKSKSTQVFKNDSQHMQLVWPASRVGGAYMISARIDVSEIAPQIQAFIWRIAGFSLLITLIVTVAAIATLERLILRPIRNMHLGLMTIADDPSLQEPKLLTKFWRDELGDLTDAVNHLMKRLAAAFEQIRDQHQTMEKQKTELENLVAKKTQQLQIRLDQMRRRAAQQQDDEGSPGSVHKEGTPGETETASIGNLSDRRITGQLHNEYTDTLTGLSNRARFWDHCNILVRQIRRSSGQAAVLFVDLDDFGKINDAVGYDAGNEALQLIAGRLQQVVRESDSVARLSGDEFAIIQTNIDEQHQPAVLAERVISSFVEPLWVQDENFKLDVSIGITTLPDPGAEVEDVMRKANMAMRRAKDASQSAYRFFVPEMDARARKLRRMELDLQQALDDGQLLVHYQPKLDLRSGQISSMEALVRWRHPEDGWIDPEEFVPVAERSRMILQLGEWVLRQACRQTRIWRAEGLAGLKVAVNMSAVQIRQGGMVDTVRRVLLETDLPAEALELEVTESAVMDDMGEMRRALENLRGLGLCIGIDDFGTGYTSLQYLTQLPFDRVKIDQAFVKNITGAGSDAAIAIAILGIGDDLGFDVTAEGVETNAQMEYLRSLGCQEIQGYLVSKPLPPGEFKPFVNSFDVGGDGRFAPAPASLLKSGAPRPRIVR